MIFKISKNTLKIWFLTFSLAVYPYMFWADILFYKGTFLGFSPYIFVVTLCIFSVFIGSFKNNFNKNETYVLILYFSLVVLLVLLRIIFYNEKILLSMYRTAFMVFVYIGAFLSIIGNSTAKKYFKNVIIVNVLLQAVIGIIHFYYFPFIVTGMTLDDSGDKLYVLDPGEGGFRENGLLLGANVYGNFLVIGLFLLFSDFKILSKKIRFLRLIFVVIVLWGIYLSGSRYALVMSLLVCLLFFFKNVPVKYFYLPIVILPLVLMSSSVLHNAVERTEAGGTGGRLEKLTLAIDMISEESINVIIGVPTKVVINKRTASGVHFSDNSYMYILTTFGCVIGLLFFLVIGYILICNVKTNSETLVFYLYVGGTFLFNNAILWDLWIFYAVAVLFVMANNKNNKTVLTINKEISWC